MIIPGFSAYSIETDGVVTKVRSGEVIKPHIVKNRNRYYVRVSLKGDDGRIRTYSVLSLLAVTYLGKPLHSGVATAKDGNNFNTTLENVLCTNNSDITKQAWKNGAMVNRHKRERCYDDASIEMVYEAMQAYDRPVTMSELCYELQVPYSTVRYSVVELRKAHKVRKTATGFEVVK